MKFFLKPKLALLLLAVAATEKVKKTNTRMNPAGKPTQACFPKPI